MADYDFIIAGGGAAGLSLAYHMLLSPLREKRILIIDKDDDDQLNRNWGFWTKEPTLFDRVVHHTWKELDFVSPSLQRRYDLGDYRYCLMHGSSFYTFVLQRLAECPNITFQRGVIRKVRESVDGACVEVDGHACTGSMVFNSIVRPNELRRQTPNSLWLRMQFKGWEIQTTTSAFDPRAARLFDLRTPQEGLLRFFYVMPYGVDHAFIEYTVFSPNVLRQTEYNTALHAYISQVLDIQSYRVLCEENGAVGLTNYSFRRKASPHIMNIGARGGRIKPSTGYSFMRIQHDSAAIVQSLLQSGQPFDVPVERAVYRLCDTMMLRLMIENGSAIAPVFTQLFRSNPIDRILRFLDEEGNSIETLAIIASLARSPLMRELLHR
ncbi:MAG TPA: lycopene cyclase family protein [Anaerolineae bacterium]|jgi:lycopene beta-cyclase